MSFLFFLTGLKINIRILIFSFMVIFISQVRSQNVGKPLLFRSEEILEIDMICDFSQLLEKRADTNFKLPAKIVVHNIDIQNDTVECELSIRGKFRRKAENCDFPPLKVKFKKSKTANSCFAGIKSLKVVTHCKTSNQAYDDLIFAENLVYKLWDHCSEYAFSTRLIKVKYIFENQNDTIILGNGFFIEDDDDLARRCNADLIENPGIDIIEVDRKSLLKFAVFQYMIGNIDYSVSMLHNADVLKLKDNKKMIPVPYDFDYSEFVSPPYADLVSRFTEKNSGYIFRSICPTNEELSDMFLFYNSLKKELLRIIKKEDHLSKKKKTLINNYLKDFYNIIHDDNLVKEEFYINCNL